MATPGTRLVRWQILSVILMVIGYSGYYLCRSDFSVALPMIIDDLAKQGFDVRQGTAVSKLPTSQTSAGSRCHLIVCKNLGEVAGRLNDSTDAIVLAEQI